MTMDFYDSRFSDPDMEPGNPSTDEPERDSLWENVYASVDKVTYVDDDFDEFVELVEFRVTVIVNNDPQWVYQRMLRSDYEDIVAPEEEVFRWMWNEMVDMLDERLENEGCRK